jgi:hypothetical protein
MRCLFWTAAAVVSMSGAQTRRTEPEPVCLFSCFINNGEDGLHLAFSRDGYEWKALKGGNSFLKPTVGRDRLMRDPFILRGPDVHLVWTVSWRERGIGYARSRDLLCWSSQEYIPVMENEKTALNCWAPEIFYDAGKRRYDDPGQISGDRRSRRHRVLKSRAQPSDILRIQQRYGELQRNPAVL